MNIQKLISETEEYLHFLKSLLTKIKFTPKSKKRKPIKRITILKKVEPTIYKIIITNYVSKQNEYYEGQIINNLRHGRGKHYKHEQLIYDGDYKDNLRHGYGKLYQNNKLLYEGQWLNNKKHGKGKEYNFNGDIIYYGDFSYDLRDRCGKIYDEGDLIYDGMWKDELYFW